MASVERTMRVATAPAKVWAYLSDFRTTQDWDPPTVRTERTSGDGGVGTTYHNVSRLLGGDRHVDYVVTEYVEGSRIQLAGDAGSVRLLDTITVAPAGAGTRVHYHSVFTLTGAARLAAPVMPLALKILADRVAASIEERLQRLS